MINVCSAACDDKDCPFYARCFPALSEIETHAQKVERYMLDLQAKIQAQMIDEPDRDYRLYLSGRYSQIKEDLQILLDPAPSIDKI